MDINFSDREEAERQLEQVLKKDFGQLDTSIPELVELEQENIVEQLYNAVLVLLKFSSPVKNIRIKNKLEQKQVFLDAYENEEEFEPEFEFQEFPYNEETFVLFIDILTGECEKINRSTLRNYGAEEIGVGEFQEFWEQIFEELKLYVKLAANIENEKKWREISMELWPMASEKVVDEVKQRLEDRFNSSEEEKELEAKHLKDMWINELERLGVDYNVEVRDVAGCFNIPEEQTVVVARGYEEERLYSRKEAEMLTMHELFHVIRGYNGRKACEKSGLPPILGVHTPFYDQTEEGGALYREKATGTDYPEQWKDYHLRFMAAYYLSEGIEFTEVVEKLIESGAEPGRAFELVARNREVLRHHIYLGGYYRWEDADEETIESLLAGKLNPHYAEIFREEVEADGMVQKPEIGVEELFEFEYSEN